MSGPTWWHLIAKDAVGMVNIMNSGVKMVIRLVWLNRALWGWPVILMLSWCFQNRNIWNRTKSKEQKCLLNSYLVCMSRGVLSLLNGSLTEITKHRVSAFCKSQVWAGYRPRPPTPAPLPKIYVVWVCPCLPLKGPIALYQVDCTLEKENSGECNLV